MKGASGKVSPVVALSLGSCLRAGWLLGFKCRCCGRRSTLRPLSLQIAGYPTDIDTDDLALNCKACRKATGKPQPFITFPVYPS